MINRLDNMRELSLERHEDLILLFEKQVVKGQEEEYMKLQRVEKGTLSNGSKSLKSEKQ